MKEEIIKKLKVFGTGQLQDLVTLSGILEREGVSIKEVGEFLEKNIRIFKEQQDKMKKLFEERTRKWNENTRKCPTCEAPLVARSITLEKGKENVKGYTCHWFCRDEECNFEEYTHENFKEVYQKIMGGR